MQTQQLDQLIQECVNTGRLNVMMQIQEFLAKPETKSKLAEFLADPAQGKYISEYMAHLISEEVNKWVTRDHA